MQNIYLKHSKGYKFINVLIIIVFFSGFINIPFSAKLQPASLIIDLLIGIMFTMVIFHIAKKRGKITINTFITWYIILFLMYFLFLTTGHEPFYNKLLSLREKLFYLFIPIFIFKFITVKKEIDKLLKHILTLGLIFSAFGIFQFLFRTHLPIWLLTPKYINVFGYSGTDITRSTGLLGNTIVYGNIMLLFFAIFINNFLMNANFKNFLVVIISTLSIFCTFSRASIIGSVFIAVVSIINIYRHKVYLKQIIILCIGVCTFIVIIAISFDSIKNSFIYNNLFSGDNASIQYSNAGHMMFLQESLSLIKEHIFFGVGIATQTALSNYSQSNLYVTDSTVMGRLLEIGVVGLTINMIFVIIGLVYVNKVRKTNEYNYLATGFLYFSIYQFCFSSIINSAYGDKINTIIFWTIFGIILGVYKINRKDAIVNV